MGPTLAVFLALTGIFTPMAEAADADAGVRLLQAAASGDLQEIRRLLAAGAPIDTRDGQGRTALLLAVDANHVEIAKALLDAGASVNAQAENLDTPWLLAGARGHTEIIAMMLPRTPDLKRSAGPNRKPATWGRSGDRRRIRRGHGRIRRFGRLRTMSSRFSTGSSPGSTSQPKTSASKRSKPWVTPTWRCAACPCRWRTTPSVWFAWLSAWSTSPASTPWSITFPLSSGSASTAVRWWPASSAKANTSTTCGAIP